MIPIIKVLVVLVVLTVGAKELTPKRTNYTPPKQISEMLKKRLGGVPDVPAVTEPDRNSSEYDTRFRRIILSEQYADQHYVHEIGHVMWYQVMADSDKQWFIDHEWYPTGYAKTSTVEAFAECFHWYVYQLPGMPPELTQFFDRMYGTKTKP